MTTERILCIGLAAAALGCAADVDDRNPPVDSEVAALCGQNRTGSTPPAAMVSTDGSGASRWFVVDAIGFGDRDLRTGTPATDAWRCYGFDLDGQSTMLTQSMTKTGSCARLPGSPSDALMDGAGGIDDAFGHHTFPVLRLLDECLDDPSRQLARSTILLRIDGDPTVDASHVAGALYVGRPLGAVVDSIIHIPPATPVAVFPEGYVSNGFWVSGPAFGARIDLPLNVGARLFPDQSVSHACPAAYELRVPISDVVLTMRVAGGEGMLGGAIPIASLRKSLDAWLSRAEQCPLSPGLTTTLVQSADLASDASGDASRACDAISIGLGLTLRAVPQPPPIVALAPDARDCASPQE